MEASFMSAFSLRLFSATVVAALTLTTPAFGAVDMFLKIEGIEGESIGQPGIIDIRGYSHEVLSSREAGSGLATGKRQHKPACTPYTFSCPLSKATPQLLQACSTGQVFPQAVLRCVRTGEAEPFYKVTMSDVMVSSYQASGAQSDEVPVDTFSLSFSRIQIDFLLKGEVSSWSFGATNSTR
jgi:type VI secretion system secreted protein Hcp